MFSNSISSHVGVTSEQGQRWHRFPNIQQCSPSEQLGVNTNLWSLDLRGLSLGLCLEARTYLDGTRQALTQLPKDFTRGEGPTVGFAQGWFNASIGPKHPLALGGP